jgi:large subunit ribosomal protein L21
LRLFLKADWSEGPGEHDFAHSIRFEGCAPESGLGLWGSAGGFMYAVIRTGGKQYRVAPGDVVKIEKVETEGEAQTVVFSDVLAVSGEPGTIVKPATATVTAEVVSDGRHAKILVFHLKRKKQYKKMQGHRQAFTEVRIKSIEVDGVALSAAV